MQYKNSNIRTKCQRQELIQDTRQIEAQVSFLNHIDGTILEIEKYIMTIYQNTNPYEIETANLSANAALTLLRMKARNHVKKRNYETLNMGKNRIYKFQQKLQNEISDRQDIMGIINNFIGHMFQTLDGKKIKIPIPHDIEFNEEIANSVFQIYLGSRHKIENRRQEIKKNAYKYVEMLENEKREARENAKFFNNMNTYCDVNGLNVHVRSKDLRVSNSEEANNTTQTTQNPIVLPPNLTGEDLDEDFSTHQGKDLDEDFSPPDEDFNVTDREQQHLYPKEQEYIDWFHQLREGDAVDCTVMFENQLYWTSGHIVSVKQNYKVLVNIDYTKENQWKNGGQVAKLHEFTKSKGEFFKSNKNDYNFFLNQCSFNNY